MNSNTVMTLVGEGHKGLLHNRLVTKPRSAQLCGLLRNASLYVLPDCGHLSHEETPSLLLDVLAHFVDDIICQTPSLGRK